MKKKMVLLIEDEEAIRDMLRFSFSSTEFHLIDADTAQTAIQLLETVIPNLIILDWMLPDKSGIDFIRWIRKNDLYKNIPIIMLTAKAEEENKINALMLGADDYLTKPFSPNELTARIKAVLRRGVVKDIQDEIRFLELSLNESNCQVEVKNHRLALTPTEYKILHFFLLHTNKVYSREQLLNRVWGRHAYLDERTIDAQIKRLRQKLKPHHYDIYLKTIRGMGYLFGEENYNEKNH